MPGVTLPVHKSYQDLEHLDFVGYADQLASSRLDGDETKKAFAKMAQVVAKDEAEILASRNAAIASFIAQKKRRRKLEALQTAYNFDFDKATTIFDQQTITTADVLTACAQDDQDLHVRGLSIDASLVITGDRVKIDGISTGLAVDGTLQCTTTVAGQLSLGGSDIIVRGIKFTSDVEKALVFTDTCTNLTIENCIFQTEHAPYSDSKWFYGGGGHLNGSLTISNCLIGGDGKGFGSWFLGDATTASSATQTNRLAGTKIIDCKFEGNAGSFAIRGQAADPNGTCRFKNNLVVYGAGVQHDSFWATFEANNCKKVICTGNEVQGAERKAGGTGTRAFLQAWSRSVKPWRLSYSRNIISGFKFAAAIPCSATFYAPDSGDGDFDLGSKSGEITDVSYGAVLGYPWLSAAYAPENIAAEPYLSNETDFADGLSNLLF